MILNEPNRKTFQIGDTLYLAKLMPQVYDEKGNPLIKNGGKWHLQKATYHKNTWMRPLKRKRAQQIPRWKTVGYFETFEEARASAEEK